MKWILFLLLTGCAAAPLTPAPAPAPDEDPQGYTPFEAFSYVCPVCGRTFTAKTADGDPSCDLPPATGACCHEDN